LPGNLQIAHWPFAEPAMGSDRRAAFCGRLRGGQFAPSELRRIPGRGYQVSRREWRWADHQPGPGPAWLPDRPRDHLRVWFFGRISKLRLFGFLPGFSPFLVLD